MNLAGLPCLLIASESNEKWGPYGKIYSLDKEEIEYGYVCRNRKSREGWRSFV